MTRDELKEFLNFKAEQYENPDFIQSDPIQLVHRFSKKEDIEITGLLISTIAWGNRTSIIKSGERLLEIMQHEPYEFIRNYNSEAQRNLQFVHRTFNKEDLDFFFSGLCRIYRQDGLEKCFISHPDFQGIKGRIINFREKFLEGTDKTRSSKHISNPAANSAAKRLNMYLRWMVRSSAKNVDFGIWKSIDASELYLPLDVHTGNNARKLKLLSRKQDDWKALEEIMSVLRDFDKKDPIKYDFALFGLGVFDKW